MKKGSEGGAGKKGDYWTILHGPVGGVFDASRCRGCRQGKHGLVWTGNEPSALTHFPPSCPHRRLRLNQLPGPDIMPIIRSGSSA